MRKLYIIHGWTYSTDPWQKTIQKLEQAGLEVVMVKIPGLTTPSDQIFSINDYVDFVRQNVPKGSIVLGHSNGGRILLNLLSQDPEYFKKVILLNSAGVYEPSKTTESLKAISQALSPLKKLKPLRKIYHKVIGATDYQNAPENMKHTLANMLESDKTLKLDHITTEIAILSGGKDTSTPPRHAKKLHEQLKKSTLEIFPEWNHAPYISYPETLANIINKEVK